MASIEVYEVTSGNTTKQHSYASANAVTNIAEELKLVIYDMKSESDAAVHKKT